MDDDGSIKENPAATVDGNRSDLAKALRRVGQGDRLAFEDVYRRTSAKLFGICLRISPGRPEAEEALQEAFVTIWHKAAAFDVERGTAMTWLITVTRHRALDRLRAEKQLNLAPFDLAKSIQDPTPSADMTIDDARRSSLLAACLDQLGAGDAAMIRAGFLEGSTYRELASRAALPLPTVKSRIRRALLKLRACLQ